MYQFHVRSSLLIAILISRCACADDLASLSNSSIWQVRYCVAGKFESPDPISRKVLERLAADQAPQVARHAFANYSRIFVELDDELVRAAFDRGDFDLVGGRVTDRGVFQTPEFWTHELKETTDPTIRARAVRAIGMCGTQDHVGLLSEYTKTDNPYLLIQLALAFHRLGATQEYVETLGSILKLPIRDTLYYQTHAIDCLIQTHPDRARLAWGRVHEQFEGTQDIQPNWVFLHIVQEVRLLKQKGEPAASRDAESRR